MNGRDSCNDVRSLSSAPISLFSNVSSSEPPEVIALGLFLERVKNGCWATEVNAVRAANVHRLGEAEILKKGLPIAKLSGVFLGLKGTDLVRHNGILCLDFDAVGEGINNLRQQLATDPYVLAFFRSPKGEGIKVLVPVEATHADAHRRCFEIASNHFKPLLVGGGKLDDAPKSVSLGCFVSFDPELWVAGQEKVVSRFQDTQTHIPPPPPIPISEGSISHPLSSSLPLNPVIRAEAEQRLAALPKALKSIYGHYLSRRRVVRGARNDFLLKVIPPLFTVIAPDVLIDLFMLHYDLHAGIWSTPREGHHRAIEQMLKQWHMKYALSLPLEARAYYESLRNDRQRSAFRIGHDLATRGHGKFFMSAGVLGERLGIHCELAMRLLRGLEGDGVMRRIAVGRRWVSGRSPKATEWKWMMPLKESNAIAAAMQHMAGLN